MDPVKSTKTQIMQKFFTNPQKLVKNPHNILGRITAVAASIFVGLLTLGTLHLAFYIKTLPSEVDRKIIKVFEDYEQEHSNKQKIKIKEPTDQKEPTQISTVQTDLKKEVDISDKEKLPIDLFNDFNKALEELLAEINIKDKLPKTLDRKKLIKNAENLDRKKLIKNADKLLTRVEDNLIILGKAKEQGGGVEIEKEIDNQPNPLYTAYAKVLQAYYVLKES